MHVKDFTHDSSGMPAKMMVSEKPEEMKFNATRSGFQKLELFLLRHDDTFSISNYNIPLSHMEVKSSCSSRGRRLIDSVRIILLHRS